MRRITVVQCLPALDSGGVERSTLETARALVQRGHRSIIVSAGGRLQAQCIAEGSEHFTCEIGKKNLTLLRAIHRFHEFLKDVQPDIVHARSRLPAWAALMALRGLKPRPFFMTSVHGLNSPGFYSGVMLRAEKIICVSETARQYVLKHWPNTSIEKIAVVSPGIDVQEFPRDMAVDPIWHKAFLEEYPNLKGEKLLLLPARATRLKGHVQALKLLSALRASGEDVRLCCLGAKQAGREKYLQELQEQAQRLGVADYVEFTRPIDAVANAYAIADVVLQLSRQPESFGRTVIEALSIGKPVLGWNLGGVGENLQRYFPAGLAPVFDENVLLQTAKTLLKQKIKPAEHEWPSLLAMQSAMIEHYERSSP